MRTCTTLNITLIAFVAVFSSHTLAVDIRQNVCLDLIERYCDSNASAQVMDTCLEKGILTCAMPEYRLLASQTGMCRAALPRFFFNSETGSCESFLYGGCGGNSNNFDTKDDCLNSCFGMMRYCGGETGASCPQNYQCMEQEGETGMCVLVAK